MVKVLLIILTILSLTCSSWRKQGLKSEQPIPWPYTLCASSNSWDVKSISLYDDPNRGQEVTIKAFGVVSIAIDFLLVHFQTYHNDKFLHQQSIPFGESFDQGDTINFQYKYFIPSFALPGKYKYKFQFIDSQNEEDGCFQLQFNL